MMMRTLMIFSNHQDDILHCQELQPSNIRGWLFKQIAAIVKLGEKDKPDDKTMLFVLPCRGELHNI